MTPLAWVALLVIVIGLYAVVVEVAAEIQGRKQ